MIFSAQRRVKQIPVLLLFMHNRFFIIYIFVAKISVLICDLLLTKFEKKAEQAWHCAHY